MRLRILFAIPGIPFDGSTIKTKSLGGSETAAVCLARALAARGHIVHVFSNVEEHSEHDGVHYAPFPTFIPYAAATPHDICVIQRAPEMFSHPVASKVNVLWQHDLAMGRQTSNFRGVLWNVDRVAVLSKFMREQYKKVHSIDDRLLWQTRNGINCEDFARVTKHASDCSVHNAPAAVPGPCDCAVARGSVPVREDRPTILFTARPERGLDVLVKNIFPALLERVPDAKLWICTYDNPIDQLKAFYQDCRDALDAFDDSAEFLGHLPKADLYDRMNRAHVLAYPTPSPVGADFREISCISVMEAMACGLPVVTSKLGALPETLAKGAGKLVAYDQDDPWGDAHIAAFVDAIEFTLKPETQKKMRRAGKRAAAKLDWSGVAEQWETELVAWIEDTNRDPMRLAAHFKTRSDIMALAKLNQRHDVVPLNFLAKYEFALSHNPTLFAAYYDRVTAAAPPDLFSEMDARTGAVIQILQEIQPKTLLDYGCGAGGWAIRMSNAMPNMRVYGEDLVANKIEQSRKLLKHAEHPDHLFFCEVGSDNRMSSTVFDAAYLGEILEHIVEPWELLNQIESRVRPDGHVLFTVPQGPWELTDLDDPPDPQHLWELDAHDIRDMIGHKKNVELFGVGGIPNAVSLEPLGWLLVKYEVGGDPAVPIDMDRKLRFQRPRQSLSVNIVVGGPSDHATLHWCLKSIVHLAQEILIGDAGMTDEARRIVDQYPTTVISVPDPLEHGFEAPRNALLDAASCDWVMWLDTDERLVNQVSLSKYLRKNVYDGYSIHQHHFIVDGSFRPDMPVRLFRRVRHDDKTVRFFGMVHEHPETALNEGPGEVLVVPDVHIAHVGYLHDNMRRRRFMRNASLLLRDEEKYPDRLFQKHLIMRDNTLLIDEILRKTEGRSTPDVQRLAKETIKLYREHFLGKNPYVNLDGLSYYTRAMEVLGEGIEVLFNLQASRDGQGDQLGVNGTPIVARFIDEAEAMREIGQRLRMKMDPLQKETW